MEIVDAGRRVDVPPGARRLLAFLAVERGPVTRSRCADVLWEADDADRATRNLRSTLWRLNRSCRGLVQATADRLVLSDDVVVDSGEPTALVRRLERADRGGERVVMAGIVRMPSLLPLWNDDWALVERERVRLLWLDALEAAAERLGAAHPTAALAAARAAVELEPLQESAWRQVISINVGQGNVASAHRAYAAYQELLHRELGLSPSPLIEAQVAHLATE